ncbi:MAG: hypothetical protein HQ581_20635 [Planctomycetes bacterium]|nr:hypothetical protein [Planctomycetota bacterium]
MSYTRRLILALTVLSMAAFACSSRVVPAAAQDDPSPAPEAPADPFGDPPPSPFGDAPGDPPAKGDANPFGDPPADPPADAPAHPFGTAPGDPPGDDHANPFGDPPGNDHANPFGDANRLPAEPKPEPEPKAEIFVGDPSEEDVALRSGEAAIRKILPRKVIFRCEKDEPLSEVIARLRREHKVQMVFDRREIEQVLGIVPEEIFVPACDFPGISLGAALELMLEPLELTWVIDKDVLLITTREKEENLMTTKVHDVGDLVMYRDGQGRILADYDSLEEMITTNILQESWEEVGGPGTISHKRYTNAETLVVRQTTRIHERIEKLLADIRAIARKNLARGGDSLPPLRLSPPTSRYSSSMGGGGMMGGGGGGGGW